MLKANPNARVVSLVLATAGMSYTFFETKTGSIHDAAGNSVTSILEYTISSMVSADDQISRVLTRPLQQLQLLKSAVATRTLPDDVLQEARVTIAEMETSLKAPLQKANALKGELKAARTLLGFAKLYDNEQKAPVQEVEETVTQAQAQAVMPNEEARELIQNGRFLAERLGGLTERLNEMNRVSSAKVRTEGLSKAQLPEDVRSLAGSLLGQLIGGAWLEAQENKAREAKPEDPQSLAPLKGCGESDCYHCSNEGAALSDSQESDDLASMLGNALARRDKTDGMVKPMLFRLNPGESIEDGLRRALNIEGDIHMEITPVNSKTFH
jgi:hypothetical protein